MIKLSHFPFQGIDLYFYVWYDAIIMFALKGFMLAICRHYTIWKSTTVILKGARKQGHITCMSWLLSYYSSHWIDFKIFLLTWSVRSTDLQDFLYIDP